MALSQPAPGAPPREAPPEAHQIAPAEPPPASYPGVLLPLAEAAWAAGLAREELIALIQRGAIRSRRLVRGRRVLAAVALKDLEELVRGLESERTRRAAAEHELERRLARAEGELAASTRVERALQAYADKLEQRMERTVAGLERRLAESRKREMTLARMLGAAEAHLEAARRPKLN